MAPQAGFEPATDRLTADSSTTELLRNVMPGNVLLSQGEIPQLPSALKSLTSVFGMGTGVTSSPLSPDSSYPFKGQVLLYNIFSIFQGFFKNYSLKTR
jgi:hypothetical protein